MQLRARYTQLLHRWPLQNTASRALRKLQALCTTDSFTARLVASCILAAGILLAAYLAARLPLDL